MAIASSTAPRRRYRRRRYLQHHAVSIHRPEGGGSAQGEIKALNDILSKTVYEHEEDGGTMVVPGHGYLSNEHEVLEYRDMTVIIRDRMPRHDQRRAPRWSVKAARFRCRLRHALRREHGPWTTDMFVEAVYNSLKNPPKMAAK